MLHSFYSYHTCKFWIKVKLYHETLVVSDKAEFFSLVFIIFSPSSVSPDAAVQSGIQSECVTDYIFVSFFGSIADMFLFYTTISKFDILIYSRVHISSNTAFFKILKKPSIVQK